MIFPWTLEMAVPLFFIALAILGAGGIVLLAQLLRSFPFSKRTRKRRGGLPRVIKILASGCVFALGLSLLMLALFARTYVVFTREKPVARIRCVPVEGRDHRMILSFVPLEDGEEGIPRIFRLNGDQWAVGGHIVQWHPWLNLLGLHTGYRITRIEGRYLKAGDETSQRRTVYDLEDSKIQRVWYWLYRHHEDIPWVKAAYGNTAYTFPDKDQTFVVRVTHSGFMVAPARSEF